jgi:hypothetical protein
MDDFLTALLLSRDPLFKIKVTFSILRCAIAISREATTVPNHANRVAMATSVTRDPEGHATNFMLLLSASGLVTKDSTIAEIVTAVTSLWDVVAGR